MGHLVTLEKLEPSPSWYFSDAQWSWEGRRWIYKFPSEDFSYHVAIHESDIERYNNRKIEIRRWIEKHIPGTVIFDKLDKTYQVYYSQDRTWPECYEHSNKWWVFYFEAEEDALLFKLAFSEYVKEITDLDPTTKHEHEKTSYCKTY